MAAKITTVAGMTTISPASFVASNAFAAVRDVRPNVLFIAIDDMNTNISAFGDPSVKTPHMEALARRGVAFDRAYCQFPLCNPSRTSVMTGLRPENSGVLTNDVYWHDRIPHALDLPQHFANHGYDTVAVGKIFHATQRGNRGAGWTRVVDTRGRRTASGAGDMNWTERCVMQSGRAEDLRPWPSLISGALRDWTAKT
jgi:arylsulfatase A-like enzyme